MGVYEHSRWKIFNQSQHPFRHQLGDFAYTPARLPGVADVEAALDYIINILVPDYQGTVATPALLPISGNTHGDYYVVTDDGDGKAAGYVYTTLDGSSSWVKRYDMDWSSDSILAEFVDKTQYMYLHKYGQDDHDGAGIFVGQQVWGGASNDTNLTLHATRGTGGYVQVADDFRPTSDNGLDLGTASRSFKDGYFGTSVNVDTLTFSTGSITDSTGAIDFGDETLITTGHGTFGELTTSKFNTPYEKTINISPSGGDYTSIQAALDANTSGGEVFIVNAGTYTDDTINFTANNQCVIGVGCARFQTVTTADSTIINFGAYTGCRITNLKLQMTNPTTAKSMIIGSGMLNVRFCSLEVTVTNDIAGLSQPSVINTTGDVTISFGMISYSNSGNIAAAVKSAIILGADCEIELDRVMLTCSGSNSSIALTTTFGTSNGILTARRCDVIVNDQDSSNLVGIYNSASSGTSSLIENNVVVTGNGNNAFGLFMNGSGTIRAIRNSVVVTASGGAYGASVNATSTLISVFNNDTALQGIIGPGTVVRTSADELGNIQTTGTSIVNTMVFSTGSITDTTGAISFGDENLTTTGQVNAGNLRLDTNAISSIDTNGNIILDPNGTGIISTLANIVPTAGLNLGADGNEFGGLYMQAAGKIYDDTGTPEEFLISELMDLKSANYRDSGRTQPVQTGDALFWSGSQWLASNPDTEIDHGELSGLGDDDHTQYALLAGRSGGQTLYGSTDSGENLTLSSTSDATKGDIITDSDIRPNADAAFSGGWTGIDLGDSSYSYLDLYMKGQAYGMRLQNATTGAPPSASANTIGRLYYATDNNSIYADHGGSWVKKTTSKYLSDTSWNGSQSTQTFTVSGSVGDARTCQWTFHDNANDYEQIFCKITAISATQVTVTLNDNLPSASYRLIGIE